MRELNELEVSRVNGGGPTMIDYLEEITKGNLLGALEIMVTITEK